MQILYEINGGTARKDKAKCEVRQGVSQEARLKDVFLLALSSEVGDAGIELVQMGL